MANSSRPISLIGLARLGAAFFWCSLETSFVSDCCLWKNTCGDKLPAVFDAGGIIDAQDFDGSPSYRSFSFEDRTHIEKMIVPGICSRIEERNEISRNWIVAGGIWPFGTVAIGASYTGVFHGCLAAVLLRSDMIQFMRQERLGLRKQAILALSPGPFPNPFTAKGGHGLRGGPRIFQGNFGLGP